jgi:uncharacterized membrane protein
MLKIASFPFQDPEPPSYPQGPAPGRATLRRAAGRTRRCGTMCGVASDVVPASVQDPLVGGASEAVGGPLGAHAAVEPRRRFWTPLRIVLALTVVVCALGWAQKYPCRDGTWTNHQQYTWMCYTDVTALYGAEDLDAGAIPYADHAVEYPVVIGGVMAVASQAVRLFPQPDRLERFFDVTAIILAAGALVMVWTTLRLAGRRRPWDAAMVALAPVLLLHAYTNWDLVAVALTGAALLAWARRRPALAGVLLGLGVATKLYPLLVVLALGLLCLRAGRLKAWFATVAAGVVTWLVVDVPVWAAYPHAFGRFFMLNRTRVADFDSLFYALAHATGISYDPQRMPGAAPTHLNVYEAVAVVVLLAIVAVLTLRAPRRPRVAQVCFLVLLAFLLANKVWSPQYALWLLPLAVLARPRWPAFLAWQGAAVFLLFTRFYFFVDMAHSGTGVPAWVFLVAVLIRDATLLVLAGLVVRDMWHPEHDAVRRSGTDADAAEADDPAGGALAGAPDRFVLAPSGRPRVLSAGS